MDYVCDVCGGVISNSTVLTLTVVDEGGAGVTGATVTAIFGTSEISLGTTDGDGKLSYELTHGTYTICIESLPEYWFIANNYHEFEINETQSTLSFTAIDNTPNGSEERPFYAGDGTEAVAMPAGATHIYYANGSSRYVIVRNAGVKLTYNGAEYLPDENGVVKVLLITPESTYERIFFTLTNTLDTENSVSLSFEALPGSYDNPHSAVIGELTEATVEKGKMVYYEWTAEEDGILRASSNDENNLITLRNGVVVTESSDGCAFVEISVSTGDTVIIEIASKDGVSDTDNVEFTLTFSEMAE